MKERLYNLEDINNVKYLIQEIEEGIKARNKNEYYIEYGWSNIKGKGSKAYIIKRINLLREKLLDLKKKII